MGDLVHNYNIN